MPQPKVCLTKARCSHCGLVTSEDRLKFRRGMYECWPCWNFIKLDGPAARHWAPVIRDLLSNIDMYDQTQFLPAAGLSNAEIGAFFKTAERIILHSANLLEQHNEPIPAISPCLREYNEATGKAEYAPAAGITAESLRSHFGTGVKTQ